MSVFTAAEIAYLQGQRLGRLATVNAAGEPHVVPVGFRYNADSTRLTSAATASGAARSSATRSATGEWPLSWTMCRRSTLPGARCRGSWARGGAGGGRQGDHAQLRRRTYRITPAHIVAGGLTVGHSRQIVVL